MKFTSISIPLLNSSGLQQRDILICESHLSEKVLPGIIATPVCSNNLLQNESESRPVLSMLAKANKPAWGGFNFKSDFDSLEIKKLVFSSIISMRRVQQLLISEK